MFFFFFIFVIVTIEGFIKSEFSQAVVSEVTTYIGSICHGNYRLELRIQDSDVIGKFKIKSKISVSGLLRFDYLPGYLYIQSLSNIKQLEGEATDEYMKKAIYLPRKRALVIIFFCF